MFEKFNELLASLNSECIDKADEDLTLLEDSMKHVLDAWTDYMFSRAIAPSDKESEMYHRWYKLITKW